MNRIVILLLVSGLPKLALAAPGAHLLEQRLTLNLGTLAGEAPPPDDLSPPPPPPPVRPLAPAEYAPPLEPAEEPGAPAGYRLDLSPGEGPPSIGPVLGLLITGWVALGVGAYAGLVSLLAFEQAASSRNSSGQTEAAVTILVIGLIHLGIGLPLVIMGFAKKAARNRYYEEHPNAWLQPGSNGRLAVFTF